MGARKTEDPDRGCGCVLGVTLLAFVGYVIYDTIRYQRLPQILEDAVRTIEAIGMCAGLAVLLVGVLVLYSLLSGRQDQNSARSASVGQLALCVPLELSPRSDGEAPLDLRDFTPSEAGDAIRVVLDTTPEGISLALPASPLPWPGPGANNEDLYGQSSEGLPSTISLPRGHFSVYFVWLGETGGAGHRVYTPGQPGSSGPLPAGLSHSAFDIVVAYDATAETSSPGGSYHPTRIVPLARPRAFRLVALGRSRLRDEKATRDLYERLRPYTQPVVDEFDSEEYNRSRPILWWW